MKRFLLLSAMIFVFAAHSKAQYVTIPDPQFRSWLMTYYPGCFNASEQMDTTCSAIVNETQIDISAPSNWEGFQYFKNLRDITINSAQTLPGFPVSTRSLRISGGVLTSIQSFPAGLTDLRIEFMTSLSSIQSFPNSLTHININLTDVLPALPALPNSLTYLNCTSCYRLTSLPSLPNALDTLICSADSLLAIPALPASLKYLDCYGNYLTGMPALPVSLKYLDCHLNMPFTTFPPFPAQLEYCDVSGLSLTSLPSLTSNLKTLKCGNNPIGSLPVLPASLQNLSCDGNQLIAIPTLPSGLLTLDCSSNVNLTSLPALPAGLTGLACRVDHLSALPVLPATLLSLACNNNVLTALPVLPPGLTTLLCNDNLLTTLPALPNTIDYINCANNQLTSIPPLPTALTYFQCYQNQIYFLPDLPPTLQIIYCDFNHMTCVPVLPNGIQMSIDNTVTCIPNQPASYQLNVTDVAQGSVEYYSNYDPYPTCSVINNVNHCASFPVMSGHVFNDNNNNGVKDANEPYRAAVKIQLSNGAFTLSNSNGYYEIPADNTGNYTVSIVPPNYFTSVPLQFNYNFSTYDTLVTNDFALQPTTIRDSLNININPVNTAARPGFPYPYQIAYSNDGTTTLNSNVAFNYDNTRLIFDSCSNASVINTGNSLTLPEPGFAPGIQKSFIGYFRVNPAAVIGDSLRSGAHITSGSAAAHDSDVVAIRGSFDPNDKSATPSLIPAQVANGDYIYYTIRFQNTGTDTAFSIVITDTLDARLQPSTLQMIATSHPCITTVKGNTISFEFINILLPDSNVNQLKSHGYISFRIKPLNTLVVNDIVPNKAAIYFDYNSPVITNIATTTVVNPIVVPLKLLSFTVSRGVGQHANLYWQTNDEVNVQQYIVEMSSNGRAYNAVGFENAKGFQYNSYVKSIAIPADAVLYFRLKMMDIDGRFTYSNIAILKNVDTHAAFSLLNNPVKDELSISLQDESLRNTSATIFNAQGVKVRTILLQHDVENINVKSLPAGSYYLVTEKGSRQFVVIK